MRFRVIPRSVTFDDVFTELGDLLVEATTTLTELATAWHDDREPVRARLADTARRGEAVSLEGMQRVYSSFITPFDRSDTHTLIRTLTDCLDNIEATGDLLVLYRVADLPEPASTLIGLLGRLAELTARAMRRLASPRDLTAYWAEIRRLENEANRAHRRCLAAIFDSRADLPTMLKQREVAGELEAAANSFARVCQCVQTIAAKES